MLFWDLLLKCMTLVLNVFPFPTIKTYDYNEKNKITTLKNDLLNHIKEKSVFGDSVFLSSQFSQKAGFIDKNGFFQVKAKRRFSPRISQNSDLHATYLRLALPIQKLKT